MRRSLFAVLLVAGVLAVPASAGDADEAPVYYHVPGRIAVGPAASPAQWVHQTYEAFAGRSEPGRELLRRLDTANASAAAEDGEITFVFVAGDLDGDGVSDLVRYHTEYEQADHSYVGRTEVALYSGRSGALRWRRSLARFPLAMPLVVNVGRGGQPGLMLLNATLTKDRDRVVRIVGVTGARGTTAYDRTITTADGRGQIGFGGTFDAYPGGGTELLISRIHTVASVALNVPGAYEAEPFVLSGNDGVVRSVRTRATVVAHGVGYVAVGDVDRDRRDDFVEVRRTDRAMADISLYGVSEEQTYWTVRGVPAGFSVMHSGTADLAGDKRREVLLDSWVSGSGWWGPTVVKDVVDGVLLLRSPAEGIHGLLLDGRTGALRWDHLDGELGGHQVWDDLDRDGKPDVLAQSLLSGKRDGVRFVALNGAGKVLYRRDITIEAPVARHGIFVMSTWAGDLDGDRIRDLGYFVASASKVQMRTTAGLFLVGKNQPVVTAQVPLGASLDGGTAERVRRSTADGVTTITVLDGWRGKAYWSVQARGKRATWGLIALDGTRGRCAGALLYGADGESLWVDALDGATGRVRWSRTLIGGKRPATTVRASGRPARCR